MYDLPMSETLSGITDFNKWFSVIGSPESCMGFTKLWIKETPGCKGKNKYYNLVNENLNW